MERTSIKDQASTSKGVYGASESARAAYSSELASNDRKENARAGVLSGYTSDADYSRGAYFWDGKDFKSGGGHTARYSPGFSFSQSNHNLFSQGDHKVSGSTSFGKWSYKYQSTHAAGNTTFSTTTMEWRDAQLPGGSVGGPMGTNFGRIIKP